MSYNWGFPQENESYDCHMTYSFCFIVQSYLKMAERKDRQRNQKEHHQKEHHT